MAAETKVPDGLLLSTNLTGGLGAIDTDDTTWLQASSNNSDSVVAVSFPTPTGNPNTGAGLQNFTVKYRVTANGSSVSFDAYLRENGTRINGGSPIDSWSSTSTTEVTREIAWDAALLGTADGSLVEIEVYATKSGGSPSNRTTGEFQFIDWDVDYAPPATNYTLACDGGSLSLTGTASSLLVGRAVDGLTGSYSITGSAASLVASYTVTADSGAYSLTGSTTNLLKGFPLAADSGSYTINGSTVNFLRTSILTADAGTYSIGGNSTGLLTVYKINNNNGTYSITGSTTSLQVSRKLSAGTGSFTFTGEATTLTYSGGGGDYTMAADTGVYLITNNLVSMEVGSVWIDYFIGKGSLMYSKEEEYYVLNPGTDLTGVVSELEAQNETLNKQLIELQEQAARVKVLHEELELLNARTEEAFNTTIKKEDLI